MRKFILVFLTVNLSISALVGCEPLNNKQLKTLNEQFAQTAEVKTPAPEIIWVRLTNNFQLTHPHEHARVDYYINRYKKQLHHFSQLSKYASPYLYHVVETLEKRNMPGELALLPMIESAYQPFATSHMGASGIWQLGAITGERYGLKQDHWYDGRKDIEASTNAALDYLSFLHKEFNEDWLLTLAAYNCGEGGLRKAIRKNKRLGKPIDFWSLPLPKQTRDFVPKILAIAEIIQNSNEYGIPLNPIENKPYFEKINTGNQMELGVVAHLAEMDLKHLKRLNPGYNHHVTHPEGPYHLLLPASKVSTFKTNLANTKKPATIGASHIIKPGDSLSVIAKRYQVTVAELKSLNKLTNDVIILGKELLIPGQVVQASANLPDMKLDTPESQTT